MVNPFIIVTLLQKSDTIRAKYTKQHFSSLIYVVAGSFNTGSDIINDKTLDLNFLVQLYKSYRSLSKSEKERFLEFKLYYYQFFIKVALIVTCIASLLFLVSDAQLNGYLGPTVIPRFSVLVPMIIYLIAEPAIKSRRIKTFLDYFRQKYFQP